MSKIVLLATKQGCPFCDLMKPVFEDVVKEYSQVQGLRFGLYDVDSDDWELGDKLGLEGTPALAIIGDDAETIYEINNDGLVEREVIVSMIINNLNKE